MTLHVLLLTDVADSTLLTERLGDVEMQKVWVEHDRRARDLLIPHRGREIDRTDGLLLLFDDVGNAARYALAYHSALAPLGLAARVGLHVGAVTLIANAPEDIARGAKPIEVEGLAKPFAARIMSLARGGQTLISAAARNALGDALPDGTALESHGYYRLKGIEKPVEIFELGVRDVAPFAPPPDAEKAYRVVREGDIWRPVREVRHNLPAERDVFVGRTEELRTLASRLDAGRRLVTVLGPGGTGKTRFVRRYGRTWLGDWPGGVYFCDLSEARSLDGVFFAVASALDVPLSKEDPAVQLGHGIAGRGRCLVILDNFEQVLAYAPATLGHWLDRAVDASFIVTSRERLHLPGEDILPIEPLSLDRDAIDLFVIRAQTQRPDFALTETNRSAVAEAVRLLDGLPLAIELAAARVRVLSPAQLVERLSDRFRLLAGMRGTAARQATLRAAIDWSWDLLTPWEQAALAQCATFEGGFTLDAAENVLDLAPWPAAPATLDAVQALVDKSLLRTWIPTTQGRYDVEEPYFGMYVSIREYAKEKLEATGVGAERSAEERHGRYFARFGTEDALEALFRQGGVKRRRTLAFEVDNLVAACRRAAARGDGEIAVATYRATWAVLELQGPFPLGVALGTQVLTVDGIATPSCAAARGTRALALHRSGRTKEAGTEFEQVLALARELRDRHREGTVLLNVGNLDRECGRMEEARVHLDAALAIHRELGNRRAEGNTLGTLGAVRIEQGRMEEARAHYEAALAIHREVGNRSEEGVVLGNLGNLHLEQGRVDDASAHYEAALAIHREVGYRSFEANVLGNLGALHMYQRRMEDARAHLEAALAIGREVGDRRTEGFVLASLGELDHEQGRVEEARRRYEAALAIARSLGDRRVEGYVLGHLGVLLASRGQVDEAREALRAGEALLREIGDPLWLALVLCARGRIEITAGDPDSAGASLAEAEAVAVATSAGPDSELGREIARLREALG